MGEDAIILLLGRLLSRAQPATAAEWRADRSKVLDRYPLDPHLRRAVLDDEMSVIAPRVNAYLLRFYYGVCGVKDDEFISRLRALPPGTVTHG